MAEPVKKQEIETITPGQLVEKLVKGGNKKEDAEKIAADLIGSGLVHSRLRDLNKRAVELQRSLELNQKKLDEAKTQVMVYEQSITLHTGALQDVQYWIDRETEKLKEKEPTGIDNDE
jgi:hypothetical protein